MSDRSREVDRRIVAELHRDSRQTNVAIARKVGLTEGAVRRRIENLVAAGAVRFTIETSPDLLGRHTTALLRVRCAPHLVDEVIAALASQPALERVYHVTGQFDLTVVGHFESTTHLREFTIETIGAIAGAVEIQSEIVLQALTVPPEGAKAVPDDEVDGDGGVADGASLAGSGA
ncbi:Lrp/AsnC family transcriptional regulator [Litorihabitans aurantiacus]|uniref:Transcriptional regulator n=1 Tax=Litorihabitans aurantiacus TaxID=1930061 RepID=A0AA37UNL8_9MICO|nr:Lrp/AsnC family transcriptional regulator [Litorihabitans aurantiacus]GMA30398.1 transcriptional regulator [Litorihabitans aurantiacus]